MVALKKYARMEASALWRASADAQRREVVVVLGDATLTIKTTSDQALTHWSIAAVERANPGKFPARFHPDGDRGEELEFSEDEREMVEAIDLLRRAVDKARPRPGRLRWLGFGLSAAAVAYACVFWLPGALLDHTLKVVPDVGRKEIGQQLMSRITKVTGPACSTSEKSSVLGVFGERLGVSRLAVMRGGIRDTLTLPGGTILMSRTLVEDHEEPDVAAGYVVVEKYLAGQTDALRLLLENGGTLATFRLLTTGQLDGDTLDRHAERLLASPPPSFDMSATLAAFEAVGLRSTPYAYARDLTGERTLVLIEGDPMRAKQVNPLLSDADWLRLQAICSQ